MVGIPLEKGDLSKGRSQFDSDVLLQFPLSYTRLASEF